ncbi:MAG: hypothetical protein RIR97_1847, partial [Pseudomonadota bacterium]
MTMTEILNALAGQITSKNAGLVLTSAVSFGELTLTAAPDKIIDLLTVLRDDPDCAFVNLTDICGVDYPEREDRFDVVYHLLSPTKNVRIRVKVATAEDAPVPSATPVFPGADWFEREAYD